MACIQCSVHMHYKYYYPQWRISNNQTQTTNDVRRRIFSPNSASLGSPPVRTEIRRSSGRLRACTAWPFQAIPASRKTTCLCPSKARSLPRPCRHGWGVAPQSPPSCTQSQPSDEPLTATIAPVRLAVLLAASFRRHQRQSHRAQSCTAGIEVDKHGHGSARSNTPDDLPTMPCIVQVRPLVGRVPIANPSLLTVRAYGLPEEPRPGD